MRQPLPPLNGLRAFEAAARAGSLVAAAEELRVTPSAVGHQIRALEALLRVRLFDRRARSLTLTATGRRYAEQLTEGFDLMHRATAMVRRETAGRAVTVSATPALALRWLAPALDRLRQEGIAEFRIDASSREADLPAGEAELDIRYGLVVDPGLVTDVLFSETVFPVCHPDYAAQAKFASPADLLRADLLFVDDWGKRGGRWSAWRDWFDLAGLQPDELREAGRFAEMDKSVAAAAGGWGVAMGAARHLGAGEVDGGRLIRLFGGELELRYSAFLVALPEIAEEATIKRLRRRLVALARDSRNVLHEGAF
ncbi:MAG TPA: LysR family transcriptional regulator [Mesorhizobium sp.]|nr:LysR family transcriptional regulator [Mesorhizobium sp.]